MVFLVSKAASTRRRHPLNSANPTRQYATKRPRPRWMCALAMGWAGLVALGLTLSPGVAASEDALKQSSAGFLGNAACSGCHVRESKDWQNSHHDLAMQEVSDTTVLGDFNDATFSDGSVTSRFFRKNGEYWIRTDNAQGQLEDFKVAYVFGVYPLQ